MDCGALLRLPARCGVVAVAVVAVAADGLRGCGANVESNDCATLRGGPCCCDGAGERSRDRGVRVCAGVVVGLDDGRGGSEESYDCIRA